MSRKRAAVQFIAWPGVFPGELSLSTGVASGKQQPIPQDKKREKEALWRWDNSL